MANLLKHLEGTSAAEPSSTFYVNYGNKNDANQESLTDHAGSSSRAPTAVYSKLDDNAEIFPTTHPKVPSSSSGMEQNENELSWEGVLGRSNLHNALEKLILDQQSRHGSITGPKTSFSETVDGKLHPRSLPDSPSRRRKASDTPINDAERKASDKDMRFLIHDWIDLGNDTDSELDLDHGFTLWQRLHAKLSNFIVDLLEDLSYPRAEVERRRRLNEKREAFSLRKLQKNVNRTRDNARSYLETLNGIWDVLLWRHPVTTLALFTLFMHGVYTGWLPAYLLLLAIIQMTVNYLKYHRGSPIDVYIFPWKKLDEAYEQWFTQEVYEVGAYYVLHIALIVQELLEWVSDLLEKIRSLFRWRQPEVTIRFYAILWCYFVMSVFFSGTTFFTIIGLHLCLTCFVNFYFYYHFPRIQHRIDVLTWFYDHLLTSEEARWPAIPKRSSTAIRRSKPSIPHSRKSKDETIPISVTSGSLSHISDEASSGENESSIVVQPPTAKYRACLLIDRNKTFPANVSSGSIALLDKLVVFKHRGGKKQYGMPELVKMPFEDITSIRKAKAVSTMLNISSLVPGQGMAIEIFVKQKAKPYMFAGLLHRDELYEEILQKGKELDWTS